MRLLLALVVIGLLSGCVAVGIGRHKGEPLIELEAKR